MVNENNELITISEVGRRCIIPILKRVLNRNKFSVNDPNTHEQLTLFILSNISADTNRKKCSI